MGKTLIVFTCAFVFLSFALLDTTPPLAQETGEGACPCMGSAARSLNPDTNTPLGCAQKGEIAVGLRDRTSADTEGANFLLGGEVGSPVCKPPFKPTLITLASFDASASDDRVILTWSTGAEIDNYGFNILRSASPGGSFLRINPTVIPAMGKSPGGASYTFVDKKVVNGTTYYYRLEDINVHGLITTHNTVSATPMLASRPPASEGTAVTGSTSSSAQSRSVAALKSSSEEESTQSFLFQIMTSSGSQLSVARLKPETESKDRPHKKDFSFTARGMESQVILEWVAKNGDDGYYLWRSEVDEDGTYTQITDFLLPAFDIERSDHGLKFEYSDATVSPGVTYSYKLEAMDVTGKSHFVAQASATPPAVIPPDEPQGQSSPAETEAAKGDEKVSPSGSPTVEEGAK